MSTGEDLHEPEPEPEARPEPDPRAEPESERLRLHREEITSERIFGVVYGAIAVGVLLAAEDAADETLATTVESIVVALVIYWLAHSYALVTVRRIREGWRLTPPRLASALKAELWIVVGALEPLVVLVVFWGLGANLANSETAAIWAAAVLILAVELVAGIRAHLRGQELLIQALMGAALGSLVIVLSAILH